VRHTTSINRDLLWWVVAVDAAVVAGEDPCALLIGPGHQRGMLSAHPLGRGDLLAGVDRAIGGNVGPDDDWPGDATGSLMMLSRIGSVLASTAR
jgi:hypothetical protein